MAYVALEAEKGSERSSCDREADSEVYLWASLHRPRSIQGRAELYLIQVESLRCQRRVAAIQLNPTSVTLSPRRVWRDIQLGHVASFGETCHNSFGRKEWLVELSVAVQLRAEDHEAHQNSRSRDKDCMQEGFPAIRQPIRHSSQPCQSLSLSPSSAMRKCTCQSPCPTLSASLRPIAPVFWAWAWAWAWACGGMTRTHFKDASAARERDNCAGGHPQLLAWRLDYKLT
jgi:hypothetical protein